MQSILSLLLTLLIIAFALKIAFKVTGCLIRIIIFAAALWFILMILDYNFHFFIL